MELSKDAYIEWRNHPVTRVFFKDIQLAIDEVRGAPRIYPTPEKTLIMAGIFDGKLDAYKELEEWYENKIEDFNVNEI